MLTNIKRRARRQRMTSKICVHKNYLPNVCACVCVRVCVYAYACICVYVKELIQ